MDIGEKLTVLVNSCDAYMDLWMPFFTLFQKYGGVLTNSPIILNTETEHFSIKGIDIECAHCKKGTPYGKRLISALNHVKTEYVLIMLDDFFLRQNIDYSKLIDILRWMDTDRNIVCFNSEVMDYPGSSEINKYPGFVRLSTDTPYLCNLQAAIWRTNKLKRYCRPNVTPWEWEEYCGLKTYFFPNDKFYARQKGTPCWIDYGHETIGDLWAVVQGKWVLEDVQPFFERENIDVDFSKRGCFTSYDAKNDLRSMFREERRVFRIVRYLGVRGLVSFLFYRITIIPEQLRGIEPPYYLDVVRERIHCRCVKNRGTT